MAAMLYPWYERVREASIYQGDIFDNCPVLPTPDELATKKLASVEIEWEAFDLVVMTQSCDLVQGSGKGCSPLRRSRSH